MINLSELGERLSFWQKVLIGLFLYIICTSLGLFLSSHGWAKLLGQPGNKFEYWDLQHYANLSLNWRCWAFYPLWPQILRAFQPQDSFTAIQYALTISNLIFIASLPITLLTLNRLIQSSTLSFIIFLLYILNPNSIFHGNGYTESLFSFLGIIAIFCLRSPRSLLGNAILGGSIILMSLSRPVLVQFVLAACLASTCLLFLNFKQPFQQAFKQHLYSTGLIIVCSIAGYAIYGYTCFFSTGSFWTPFQAQSEWGKAFSFRPLFLLFPQSLLNDLHGLYFPFIIFILAIILILFKIKNQRPAIYIPQNPFLSLTLFYPPVAIILYAARSWQLRQKNQLPSLTLSPALTKLSSNYIFFFCVSVAMANAVIVFLTANNYLYSLARYVFGNPFFFVALGMLADCMNGVKTRTFLYGCLAVSALGLIHQWSRWGNDLWVG